MKSLICGPELAAALAAGGTTVFTGAASARGDGTSAELPFERAFERPEAIGRHLPDRLRDRLAQGS